MNNRQNLPVNRAAEAIAELGFLAWFNRNHDIIWGLWAEHLAYMQDSTEHVLRLYQSEKCFMEYAEQIYFNEAK